MSLPTDSKSRKEIPMYSGLLKYFPKALAAVAHVSYVGNQKHNPGEPLHWSREKSNDHPDCILRHLTEAGTIDPDDGQRHSAKGAWRYLAMLEVEIEAAELEDAIKECAAVCAAQGVPFHVENFRRVLKEDHVDSRWQCVPYFDGIRHKKHQDDPPIDLNEHEHKSAISNKWTQSQVDATPLGSFPDGVVQDTLRLAGLGDPPPQAKPICYISGPMTGYPDHNFPAFDAARDLLISKGFEVISPADVDRAFDNPDELRPKDVYAERDVAILIDSQRKNRPGSCVVTLPGWNASKGAQAEVAVAEWIGLKIRDISEFK